MNTAALQKKTGLKDTFAELEEIGMGSTFSDELCDQLIDMTLFRDFTHAELEKLAGYVHVYRAPEGTTLLVEGERDSYMCILLKGKVNIFKEDADFEQKHLATILEGSTLGEISFIDDFPHSATAITATQADFVMLTKNNAEQFSNQFPLLANKLLWRLGWQLCARIRQTSGILIDYIK